MPHLNIWETLEALGWGLVALHVIKWAVNAIYFLLIQVSYTVSYGKWHHTIIGLKDPWDRLPVHIQNLLGAHWFATQAAPAWWVTDRHDTRDLIIGIFAGVVAAFLLSKPRKRRVAVGPWRMAFTPLLALIWAIPGIAAGIGIIEAVPWITKHGPFLHGGSVIANEVNTFIAAGHWYVVLLGFLGAFFFAKRASQKPADEVQWIYAERMADSIRSTSLVSVPHVFGPPGFRKRVHWLLDTKAVTPARSVWLMRLAIGGGVIVALLAGFGAWLTLAGPAAGAG
jgi:hypothetical protein